MKQNVKKDDIKIILSIDYYIDNYKFYNIDFKFEKYRDF